MRSLNVVLFCSSASRIQYFIEIFNLAEIGCIEVVSGLASEKYSTVLSMDVGLVICDSFFSSTDISLFRMLCEQESHFETYENDGLEIHAAWGVRRLTARGKKTNLGRYSALPDALQLAQVVAMAIRNKQHVQELSRAPVSNLPTLLKLDKVQLLNVLGRRQIVPYYQPKLCFQTGRILGVEVLARWQHPDKGLLPPGIFLPMVDEFRLHEDLFNCLVDQAIKLHKVSLCIDPEFVFSYNIEATQLQLEGFAWQLIERIRQAGILLKLVTLEITENQALDLQMSAIENITLLTQSGINLSLDDFGTGFSSVERLIQLPFSQIKLDSNFIDGALDTKQSRIIGFLSALSLTLGMELVAEGVETEQQFLHLKKLGVHAAQGYFFYPPMSGASLTQVLLAHDSQGLKLLPL